MTPLPRQTTQVPLAFVDTETDGVHPGRNAWEIAIIRREPDGTENVLHVFLELDLAGADPFALRIGGFYDRHPLGKWLSGPVDPRMIWSPDKPEPIRLDGQVSARTTDGYVTPTLAAHLVARWLHGAHVVGAVPNFDTEVIDRLLRSQNLQPAHHYHLVDVEPLVAGYLLGRAQANGVDDETRARYRAIGTPPWSSDDLTDAIEVEPATPEERHTALGDARWVKRLYDRVTRQP